MHGGQRELHQTLASAFHEPQASRRPGLNPRLLGTVRRTKPAGLQVTYNRHPLYFYSSDVKPGQTKGQGFFASWYVVSPTGRAIK